MQPVDRLPFWPKIGNAYLEKHLNALPHHRGIAVTSAGVMPPRCAPDTIKSVCDWVKRYPARMA
jgi:hypothetical protein